MAPGSDACPLFHPARFVSSATLKLPLVTASPGQGHIGSSLDDVLFDEGLDEDANERC